MTIARYQELLNDEAVIKVENELDFQCTTKCKKYNVGIYFNPKTSGKDSSKVRMRAPLMMVYPGDSEQSEPGRVIDKKLSIMMFSDQPERAFTYHLEMDCDKGIAHLKVDELPEVNSDIITEKTLKGIKKGILPSHRKLMKS